MEWNSFTQSEQQLLVRTESTSDVFGVLLRQMWQCHSAFKVQLAMAGRERSSSELCLTQYRVRHNTLLWKLREGSKCLLVKSEVLKADTEQHALGSFCVCSGWFSEGPSSPHPISFFPLSCSHPLHRSTRDLSKDLRIATALFRMWLFDKSSHFITLLLFKRFILANLFHC